MLTDTLAPEQIRPLTPTDLDRLRFSDWSRTTNEEIKRTLQSFPGRSIWVPDTSEYAIVTPWRHRPEIANVAELSAVRHPAAVLTDAVRRAGELGALVVVALEMDETRQPAFYGRAGLDLLERVVTYEYGVHGDERYPAGGLVVRPADPTAAADLNALIAVDRASFPWLWWNSEAEFRSYPEAPGIEVYLFFVSGEPVSYVTLTAFLGWGHLDRIAVRPDMQGRGVGMASLRFAVARMAQLGARQIGLSTQKTNERSRRLYERFGFRRANQNDYRLYGRVLRMPEGYERIT